MRWSHSFCVLHMMSPSLDYISYFSVTADWSSPQRVCYHLYLPLTLIKRYRAWHSCSFSNYLMGKLCQKTGWLKKESPNRRVFNPAPQARTTPVLTVVVQLYMILNEPEFCKGRFPTIVVFVWGGVLRSVLVKLLDFGSGMNSKHTQCHIVPCLPAQHSICNEGADFETEAAWRFEHSNVNVIDKARI